MTNNFIGKKVIVRSYGAGVFFGTLAAKDGQYTIHEFISMTSDSYGGDIIRQLRN